MGNFLKTLLKVLAVIIAVVLAIAIAILCWGYIYRTNYVYDVPKSIERTDGGDTVIAQGKALYDENGDIFEIRGINYGNLFVAEGWMTVNSVGPLLNDDGSFTKVNDQGIVEEYEEIYQEEFDAILSERFTDEEINALNDAYFNSYCTDYDFAFIKETGFNTIRLPLYYRNFIPNHYRITDEELCDSFDFSTMDFEKLDKFLEMAKAHDLKVIIDMHGVMGGQSGYEHSGTRDIDFWDNEEYIEFMCELWQNIAKHYKDDRNDLSSTILAYDLVNEPTNRNAVGTGPKQWRVMDRLYDAIREVDTEHVISIEGVWFFLSLPTPEKYGWENVLYQYHFYNFSNQYTPNWMFYNFMYAQLSITDYDVPKFVGEFTFFDQEEEWHKYLNLYDDTGLGWTVWSYKVVSVGWWDNSWGLVVNRMEIYNDLDTPVEDYKLKLDVRTATYDEIYAEWSTQYTDDGTNNGKYTVVNNEGKDTLLYKVMKEYFAQDKFKTEE